ncbi:MAG: hypothetical protein SD837_00795 [Candidatus Electrothrix scaldis]|nr:MAG: hypothetical protein SD837_00795 [Candidatus Electrothrix sp. GW3-3]
MRVSEKWNNGTIRTLGVTGYGYNEFLREGQRDFGYLAVKAASRRKKKKR